MRFGRRDARGPRAVVRQQQQAFARLVETADRRDPRQPGAVEQRVNRFAAAFVGCRRHVAARLVQHEVDALGRADFAAVERDAVALGIDRRLRIANDAAVDRDAAVARVVAPLACASRRRASRACARVRGAAPFARRALQGYAVRKPSKCAIGDRFARHVVDARRRRPLPEPAFERGERIVRNRSRRLRRGRRQDCSPSRARPSRSASLRVDARKNTPCTRPETRKRAVAIATTSSSSRADAIAFSSSPAVIGPVNFFARLPSGAIRNVVGRPFGAPKSFGGDSSGTFAIGYLHRMLFEEARHVGDFLAAEREPDRADVAAARDEARDVRHLLDARRAPGRPEIDDDPFAALCGEIERAAVERLDRKRRHLRRLGVRAANNGERRGERKREAQEHRFHAFSIESVTHRVRRQRRSQTAPASGRFR